MPKETFYKLPEEKKEKILESAKREFARVPIEEVSIKNIVENAQIARGSFYQYFESKEDLLGYIITSHFEKASKQIKEQLKAVDGDIFKFFIFLYDFMTDTCGEKEEMQFYKNIFENARTSQRFVIPEKCIKEKPLLIKEISNKIDTSNLRIESKEDLETIEKILFSVTNKAIAMTFKYESKEVAREEYLKQLEYLKYGILRRNKC